MVGLASFTHLVASGVPETPLQYTEWLLWTVFLMALAVGIVYVFLLIWSLGKHLSHEPLAQDKPLPRTPSSQVPRQR